MPIPNTRAQAASVAEVVANTLRSAGVDRVFGLPGGEILWLIEGFRRAGVEFILCRHEANAGLMAAVYGKLSGRPGVVITTLGPGAANLLLPIASSLLEREPLLALSAQIPDSWPQTHTHQRLPLLDIFGPVTKLAAPIRAETCERLLQEAIALSMAEPRGPVYLTLSADEAQSPAVALPVAVKPRAEIAQDTLLRPTPSAIAASLTELLRAADNPLVIAGLDTHPKDSHALRRWLHEWDIPFGVTPKAKGIVDEEHPGFVGVFGGLAIDGLMLGALDRADLIVGFGLDQVEIDKTWHDERPIVWLLQSPGALEIVPERQVLFGNHGEVLDALLSARPPRGWTDQFEEVRAQRRALLTLARSDRKLTPLGVLSTLSDSLPPETIVATDVGSHKYLFGQFWPSQQPETFLTSNGLSGMGYGLPAAIAAKLARPDATVLAVLGDGAFAMNSQELETAQRLRLRVIVVVLSDNSYSLIKLAQDQRGLPTTGVDFSPLDASQIASSCGVDSVQVSCLDDIREALASSEKIDESVLLDIPIEAEAYRDLV